MCLIIKDNMRLEPRVRSAGHAILVDNNRKWIKKCSLYEDDDKNLFCTAGLIPASEYLKMYGAEAFICI